MRGSEGRVRVRKGCAGVCVREGVIDVMEGAK